MKIINDKRINLSHICLILFFVLFQGCSTAPSEETVKNLITKHFEAEKLKVVELNIGGIKTLPLSEKRYMGTKGYLIEVATITLEATEDSKTYKKGERMTFRNGLIRIREKSGQDMGWIIVDISNIPL